MTYKARLSAIVQGVPAERSGVETGEPFVAGLGKVLRESPKKWENLLR
jgi:hypothetical protein